MNSPGGPLDRINSVPFYPVVLGFSFVAAAYLDSHVSVFAVLRVVVVVLVLAAALTVGFAAIARHRHLGALLAAIALIALRTDNLIRALAALVLIGLILIPVAAYGRMRHLELLPVATRTLNLVSVALVAVLVVQALQAGVPSEIAREVAPRTGATPSASSDLPDIYVLMVEDYPRPDTLARLFGFDDSPFIDALQARGFSVSSAAVANYLHTSLNTTALLQMQYVTDLEPVVAWREGRASMPDPDSLLNDNLAFDQLHDAGYTLFSSVSRWEAEAVRATDVYCQGVELNEFERNQLSGSLAGFALDSIIPAWRANRERSVVNRQLDCAAEAVEAQVSGPRFVWAHIDAPHPPVVFDAAGDPAPLSVYWEDDPVGADFVSAYKDEVSFVNERILALIDMIRARSHRDPVIIVMSDEGFKIPENGDVRDQFGILFAASTPGSPSLFGDHPSTVNVLRALFNEYLGASLPLRLTRYFVQGTGLGVGASEIADPSR